MTKIFDYCFLRHGKPTFFPHADGEAFLQPAVSALVTFVFVNITASLEAAGVDVFLAYGASEESLASVTRFGAVVLARGAVTTDGAQRAQDRGPTGGSSSVTRPQPNSRRKNADYTGIFNGKPQIIRKLHEVLD